jgi:hypothetical protein
VRVARRVNLWSVVLLLQRLLFSCE